MKNLLASLVLLSCGMALAAQDRGTVSENKSVRSRILDREVKYSVYLPPGYDDSDISYPVLYLLHGYTDDHTAWIQFGQMNRILDRCIAEGSSVPMIVVMPDAGVSWYINNAAGTENYEDMFFRELIPHIEGTYRARAGKEFRAIAGLSMGGFGSMLYALKHPDMFAASCPLSAGIYTDERLSEMPDELYGTVLSCFEQAKGKRLSEHWYKNSALRLVEDMPDSQKGAVRFYLDCGDDDFLYEGNAVMHITLRDRNIPHEFRVRDGGHTWEYWRTALPEVFRFVSAGFGR